MRLVAVVVVLAACGRIGFDGALTRSTDGGNDAADAPVPLVPHVAAIVASNADSSDFFGTGLAVSRDGSTIVVGAPGEDSVSGGNPADNSRTDAGAAYAFTLVGSTWTEQAYIKATDTTPSGNFGSAIALSSDGNVLAVGEPSPSGGAGIVHLFTRTGTTWGNEQLVTATVRDVGDEFGFAVAISGTGDTLIVGAPGEASGVAGNPNDNTTTAAGAAYVFVSNGATWTQQAYLKAATPASSESFGAAVACSADGNAVAVGAPGYANNTGKVHVFSRAGTTWSAPAAMTEPTQVAGDFYGFAVAMTGDGSKVMVGSPGEDSVVANSGAAYVGAMMLKAPDAANDDQLGAGVAIADDGTPFAGAPLRDGTAQDTGAVYEFGSAPRRLEETTAVAGDYLGQPIAVSGDGKTLAASAADADVGGLTDNGSVTISYLAP